MNISINIQSYKRAGIVDTLKLFKPKTVTVWVHNFEFKDYEKAYPSEHIMPLPDSTKGNLPRVKNHILNCQFGVNPDAVLILDDDISKIGYWQDKKPVYLEGPGLIRFIEKYSRLCQEWGYKLWGVNVNFDKQCYREYTPFSTLSYVSSSFSCFLKGNRLRYDERFPLKEDYDMTFQQCLAHRGLMRVNKAWYVKKSAENVGGCATYRSIEREREQLLLLQKKWGDDLVRMDSLENSRSHKSEKVRTYDINPVIRVPIAGI